MQINDVADAISRLQLQAASLLLYQGVLQKEPGLAYLKLLQALSDRISQDPQDPGINLRSQACLHAYGQWFRALAEVEQSWHDYLLTQILWDRNPFSQQAQRSTADLNLADGVVKAAQHDLAILQDLSDGDDKTIGRWIQLLTNLSTFSVMPSLASRLKQISSYEIVELADHYRKYGTGIFAKYQALRWHNGELIGIPTPDPIEMSSLVGYESQRDTLLKNTEFFLSGYAALHVLLYGSRGSGKSSLVKSLVSKYSDRGLRLIEVAKSDLKDLTTIMELLRAVPQKFILFVDDLSFEEEEDSYKALKVLLEGNLTARPSNLIIYATSNRRHLIREFYGDRPRPSDGDEVHAWDTMQEKLSLSDRFGLTLTFTPANQDTYLAIVRHLAIEAGISLSDEDLQFRALQWATRHNGRSGRTARQFVDFLQADLLLTKELRLDD
jgi:uncharacterized protein